MVGGMNGVAGKTRAVPHIRLLGARMTAPTVIFSSLGPCNTRSMSYTELAR
jgi:hypothetical protein